MTNNNLQDQLMEFWDTYKDKLGLGEFSDELTRFVQTLLTKKDQEHKAELEMIRKRIMKISWKVASSQKREYNLHRKPVLEILDSHINKLNSENT